MIRTLHPADLLWLPLWRGGKAREHAVTLVRLGCSGAVNTLPSIAREHALSAGRGSMWVAGEGRSLLGIVGAGPRSGPRAWEVKHLWAEEAAERVAAELLDQVAAAAAKHGARRVFLRLASHSSLVPVACRAGYVPAWEETLSVREGGAWSAGQAPANATVRKRCASDDLALFRLFCASAPATVRSAFGPTLEEWRDALEPVGRRGTVWVCARPEGPINGLMQAWQDGAGEHMSVLGDADALSAMLHTVGAHRSLEHPRRGSGGHAYILAANYQPHAGQTMESLGFTAAERYVVLVKSVAALVREVALAPASV